MPTVHQEPIPNGSSPGSGMILADLRAVECGRRTTIRAQQFGRITRRQARPADLPCHRGQILRGNGSVETGRAGVVDVAVESWRQTIVPRATPSAAARQERGATAQRERASAASNAGRGEQRKRRVTTQPPVHARWWVGQRRHSAKTRQRPDPQRASCVRPATAELTGAVAGG